ncbi:hypothetical protein [Lactobacillus phage Sabazios]|nr:hypothetical protein [Lactobacillus phage Silenus]AYH91862.1 hypothetical protein [Lactobacillus phage Sabazios]
MTKYSFTRLARYLSNEARAYAHYVLHDETAYKYEKSDALTYGKVAHAMIAGIDGDVTDDDLKSMCVRGNKELGLKKTFSTIMDAVGVASKLREDLLGTSYHSEVKIEHEAFEGRIDTLSDDAIIDYKFVAVPNFNRVWNGERFDDWIYNTHYEMQAWIYMATQPQVENYYIVAIDKKSLNYRVYDMSKVAANGDLADMITDLYNRVEKIEAGEIEPVFIDDNSEWSQKHIMQQGLKKIVYEFDGKL